MVTSWREFIRTFLEWHHLTTTSTRILYLAVFMCNLVLLFYKSRWDWLILIRRQNKNKKWILVVVWRRGLLKSIFAWDFYSAWTVLPITQALLQSAVRRKTTAVHFTTIPLNRTRPITHKAYFFGGGGGAKSASLYLHCISLVWSLLNFSVRLYEQFYGFHALRTLGKCTSCIFLGTVDCAGTTATILRA